MSRPPFRTLSGGRTLECATTCQISLDFYGVEEAVMVMKRVTQREISRSRGGRIEFHEVFFVPPFVPGLCVVFPLMTSHVSVNQSITGPPHSLANRLTPLRERHRCQSLVYGVLSSLDLT